jgi:hypothetical protein
VTRAGGAFFRLQNIPVTLQPSETITAENLSLTVPAGAPDGAYHYEIHVGNHPDPMANMGLGAFTFWKGEVGVDDPSGPGNGDDPGAWGDPWWPGLWDGDDPDMKPESEDPGHPFPADGAAGLHAYPNPFNAVSTITLNLPRPADVQVTVYNTLGREVATLTEISTLAAGTHQFTIDASNLTSGLYFVRATVPGQTDLVQKVVLVR